MASYHLSIKTVKRSVGRSATAAAAYRAGERLHCEREGRVHDYTRKPGVLSAFVVSPASAPDWVQDRAALWNAAEARESRRNAVTAREWELALPAELDAAARGIWHVVLRRRWWIGMGWFVMSPFMRRTGTGISAIIMRIF